MHYPDVEEFQRQQRFRRGLLMMGLTATLLVIYGSMSGLFYLFNASPLVAAFAGMGILFLLALPVIVWNQPRVGLYILLFGAMVFESVSNGYGQSSTIITSFVPFFWNINNVGAMYGARAVFEPFKFSLAEGLIVYTFLVWLVRSVVLRQIEFRKGALFMPFAFYMGMVAFGLFRGVATGGELQMALWEVRSQSIFFMVYLIAANVIKERQHLVHIIWICIIGTGIKGFVGVNAYIQMGGIVSDQGVLTHEESLFFNVLLFLLFVTWIGNIDKKMKWAALLLAPACIFTTLQNQRRAGIAAFIVAFIPLVPLLWYILEQRRKQVAIFAVGFGIFTSIYLPLGWTSNGAWALPARAIRSQSDPNERDAGSDYYRMVENINTKSTRDRSPIIGVGYGKPYDQVIYMPGHEKFDRFLLFMPHNSLMWIWLRIGHIGFLTFMMLMASTLILGVQMLKRTQDSMVQAVGILGITTPLMLFTFGKYDMALINYRIVIMTGVFMGILSVLDKIKTKERPDGYEVAAVEEDTVIEPRPQPRPAALSGFPG